MIKETMIEGDRKEFMQMRADAQKRVARTSEKKSKQPLQTIKDWFKQNRLFLGVRAQLANVRRSALLRSTAGLADWLCGQGRVDTVVGCLVKPNKCKWPLTIPSSGQVATQSSKWFCRADLRVQTCHALP